MKLTLSTLGCPDWTFDTICNRAREYGFEGVDFRGLLEEVDVTRTPEFTDRIERTKSKLENAGLATSALSSSITVCSADAAEENVAAAERYIAAARELDAPYVRVFGSGDADAHTLSELATVGGETMEKILSLPGADEVTWLVETHDNWTESDDCRLLLEHLPDDVDVLWDVGHTSRVGGEDPSETLAALGDDIEYVHLKDAVYDPSHPDAMDDGWRYVLPGEGELPLAAALAELDDRGYDGWLMYEHEKRWHPELSEPDVAYSAFVEWFDSVA
jgi:sugar phosphate isomerase/epimerase